MRFLHFEEIEDVYCQCGAWRYACTDSRRMPRGGEAASVASDPGRRPMRGRGTTSPSLLPPLLPHLRLPPTCKRRCYQMASPPSASKGTLLESLISDGSSLPPGGVAPTLIAGGGVTSRSGRCIHGCQFTTSYTCRFPLPELMMLILLQ